MTSRCSCTMKERVQRSLVAMTMEQRSLQISKPSTKTCDPHRHSTLWAGAGWMIGLSLLLFFIPAVNGMIAGGVGGYLVGSWSRALTAAILPAIVMAVAFWIG